MAPERCSNQPPFFESPRAAPTLWTMARRAFSDPASVIPATIYRAWTVKLPGPLPTYVLSHPDDIRRILVDKDEAFSRNAQMRTLLRRAWGEGLAAAEGERWARQHRAAAPVFRPQAVERYAPVMADVVRRTAAGWSTTTPLPLDPAIGRIVVEIVVRTLLNAGDDVDFDQLAADTPKFVRMVSTFGALDALPIPPSLLDWVRGMGRNLPEQRLRKLAMQLTQKNGDTPDAAQGFAAAIRGAGPLVDNVLGILPAGYETTARAAGWAIWLLARYPHWQEAVHAEALSASDSTALVVTRRVVQEAMRLYPPAPLLARTALRPTALRDVTLRAGDVTMLALYAMHRHHQLWDGPDQFDPERFAAGTAYDRNAFLPFGAGPRMCIAAQFALTEIAVVVSELVKLYRFDPVEVEPEISLIVSTHAKNGLWVQAHKRGAAHSVPDSMRLGDHARHLQPT